MTNQPKPPREWWILFRLYETIVMRSKEAIIDAYPDPIKPEVNLIHVIEISALTERDEMIAELELNGKFLADTLREIEWQMDLFKDGQGQPNWSEVHGNVKYALMNYEKLKRGEEI